jgi:hypothetical protein
MAVTMSHVSPLPSSWQPVKGWGAAIGDFSFALHGDRFASAKARSSGASTNCLTYCGKRTRKHPEIHLGLRDASAR